MRIASFLPSATEIACALGLQERVVGVSHECDWPPAIRGRPAVVRTLVPTAGRTGAQIDADVARTMRERGTLYVADEPLLADLAPDLILTQDLCRVCAPSEGDTAEIARRLPSRPRVLTLNPKSVGEILASIGEVGRAAGCAGAADALVAALGARIEAVRRRVPPRGPKALLLEWLDPPFTAGHWVPEMVRLAGGTELLGREGADSRRAGWEEIAAARPEIALLSPCGYHLPKVLEEAPAALAQPALAAARVAAVDADSYFARPGPRVVDGIELLAHLFHPDRAGWSGPADAFRWLR
jgi:iron complex transport system substrate-binding protein